MQTEEEGGIIKYIDLGGSLESEVVEKKRKAANGERLSQRQERK